MTEQNISEFLAREGEGKPRIRAYGAGFQINWKVRLFGNLPVEDSRGKPAGFIPSGWTHYFVTGRTIESCASKALVKEWNDSSVNFVLDRTATESPEEDEVL